LAKADVIAAFSALLDTADLALEDEPSVENAIYCWKGLNSRLCALPD
jgi:hypothetical protein